MDSKNQREFGPLVPECVKRGIGKTRAWELARDGLIETFHIGAKRFVYIDSLLSLPQRLNHTPVAKKARGGVV
jgi:hypothetical protein